MNKFVKIILVIFIFFSVTLNVFAKDDIYSMDYFRNFKENYFLCKNFNAIYYNALQMSQEQINQYEELLKHGEITSQKIIGMLDEKIKNYQELIKNCTSEDEIISEKYYIKQLYENLFSLEKIKEEKLKNVLNKEQRKTLKKIKHLERHDIKKRIKNYHKLNPKMSVFGNITE